MLARSGVVAACVGLPASNRGVLLTSELEHQIGGSRILLVRN